MIIRVKYYFAKLEFKSEYFFQYQLVKNFNRMLSSIFSKKYTLKMDIHHYGYMSKN